MEIFYKVYTLKGTFLTKIVYVLCEKLFFWLVLPLLFVLPNVHDVSHCLTEIKWRSWWCCNIYRICNQLNTSAVCLILSCTCCCCCPFSKGLWCLKPFWNNLLHLLKQARPSKTRLIEVIHRSSNLWLVDNRHLFEVCLALKQFTPKRTRYDKALSVVVLSYWAPTGNNKQGKTQTEPSLSFRTRSLHFLIPFLPSASLVALHNFAFYAVQKNTKETARSSRVCLLLAKWQQFKR